MSQIEKIRREQIIRQAEGYLDLVMCLEDRWGPSDSIIYTMTQKALFLLDGLGESSGRRSHVSFLRGQAFRVRMDYELAVGAFWESLETDSENIHTHLGMSWCYKRLGEIDLAIESLEQALDIDPTNPIILYNLACYWALAGNIANCCQSLQLAFEIDDSLRDLVDKEPDFNSVRSNPEFLSITSAIV